MRHIYSTVGNRALSKIALNRSREYLRSLISRIQLLQGSYGRLQRDVFLHRQSIAQRYHRYHGPQEADTIGCCSHGNSAALYAPAALREVLILCPPVYSLFFIITLD